MRSVVAFRIQDLYAGECTVKTHCLHSSEVDRFFMYYRGQPARRSLQCVSCGCTNASPAYLDPPHVTLARCNVLQQALALACVLLA